MPDRKTSIVDVRSLGQGLRVLVERLQPPPGGQAREDQTGVPATTECAIHVDPVSTGPGPQQGIDGFLQQHGGVDPGQIGHVHQKEKSLKTSGISPCMAWASWAS